MESVAGTDQRQPSAWERIPLFAKILAGLVLGTITGLILRQTGLSDHPQVAILETIVSLILRVLGALAPPLILLAVVQAIMRADIRKDTALKMGGLLVLNTVVAIVIGLLVANVLRPGKAAKLEPEKRPSAWEKVYTAETDPVKANILKTVADAGVPAPPAKKDIATQFLDNVPKSLVAPLVEGNVIGVILIALAFGVALRQQRDRPVRNLDDLVDIALTAMVTVLHWVVQVVPVGVFGVVTSVVSKNGFAPFISLGFFVLSVLIALFLQAVYYLVRVGTASWVRPLDLLKGGRDALVLAFSTASSTVTMPITYDCLKNKVGIRPRSAGLGALVGSNFNNDGTALYEAMSALFIAQMLGRDLPLDQQLAVVLTSILASVGAAGIPEAGLVTMTLVFNAVKLDPTYIAILLTVDWFLDRCRTAINVMGDMNVSCILDGKTPPSADELATDDTPAPPIVGPEEASEPLSPDFSTTKSEETPKTR